MTLHVPAEYAMYLDRYLANDPAVGDQRRASTFGYRYAYKIGSGYYLEVGDKASGCVSSDRARGIRLDFNPNNADPIYLDQMNPWINSNPWNLTRVDVAIDYAADLGRSLMWHDSLRKHARYGSGDHETLYFGSPGGIRHLRVYNKRLERAEVAEELYEGDWWRVEMQHRCGGSDPLPLDLFKGIRIQAPIKMEDLNPIHYAVARAVVEEPDFLLRFKDPSTRSRWRDRIRSFSDPLSPDPAKVYRDHHSLLGLDLFNIEHRSELSVISTFK